MHCRPRPDCRTKVTTCHVCGVGTLAARKSLDGYVLASAVVDLKRRTVWPLESAVQMLDMKDDQGDHNREDGFGKLLLSCKAEMQEVCENES